VSAGYSGTPLWKKLGYQAGTRARLENPPGDYLNLVDPLPPDVRFVPWGSGESDLAHVFVRRMDELRTALDRHVPTLAPRGALWVSWPKRSSGVATDVTENRIREVALPMGLVDVKVCAVDETWSALKLVRRLRDVSS
jgi:hypothetical protein